MFCCTSKAAASAEHPSALHSGSASARVNAAGAGSATSSVIDRAIAAEAAESATDAGKLGKDGQAMVSNAATGTADVSSSSAGSANRVVGAAALSSGVHANAAEVSNSSDPATHARGSSAGSNTSAPAAENRAGGSGGSDVCVENDASAKLAREDGGFGTAAHSVEIMSDAGETPRPAANFPGRPAQLPAHQQFTRQSEASIDVDGDEQYAYGGDSGYVAHEDSTHSDVNEGVEGGRTGAKQPAKGASREKEGRAHGAAPGAGATTAGASAEAPVATIAIKDRDMNNGHTHTLSVTAAVPHAVKVAAALLREYRRVESATTASSRNKNSNPKQPHASSTTIHGGNGGSSRNHPNNPNGASTTGRSNPSRIPRLSSSQHRSGAGAGVAAAVVAPPPAPSVQPEAAAADATTTIHVVVPASPLNYATPSKIPFPAAASGGGTSRSSRHSRADGNGHGSYAGALPNQMPRSARSTDKSRVSPVRSHLLQSTSSFRNTAPLSSSFASAVAAGSSPSHLHTTVAATAAAEVPPLIATTATWEGTLRGTVPMSDRTAKGNASWDTSPIIPIGLWPISSPAASAADAIAPLASGMATASPRPSPSSSSAATAMSASKPVPLSARSRAGTAVASPLSAKAGVSSAHRRSVSASKRRSYIGTSRKQPFSLAFDGHSSPAATAAETNNGHGGTASAPNSARPAGTTANNSPSKRVTSPPAAASVTVTPQRESRASRASTRLSVSAGGADQTGQTGTRSRSKSKSRSRRISITHLNVENVAIPHSVAAAIQAAAAATNTSHVPGNNASKAGFHPSAAAAKAKQQQAQSHQRFAPSRTSIGATRSRASPAASAVRGRSTAAAPATSTAHNGSPQQQHQKISSSATRPGRGGGGARGVASPAPKTASPQVPVRKQETFGPVTPVTPQLQHPATGEAVLASSGTVAIRDSHDEAMAGMRSSSTGAGTVYDQLASSIDLSHAQLIADAVHRGARGPGRRGSASASHIDSALSSSTSAVAAPLHAANVVSPSTTSAEASADANDAGNHALTRQGSRVAFRLHHDQNGHQNADQKQASDIAIARLSSRSEGDESIDSAAATVVTVTSSIHPVEGSPTVDDAPVLKVGTRNRTPIMAQSSFIRVQFQPAHAVSRAEHEDAPDHDATASGTGRSRGDTQTSALTSDSGDAAASPAISVSGGAGAGNIPSSARTDSSATTAASLSAAPSSSPVPHAEFSKRRSPRQPSRSVERPGANLDRSNAAVAGAGAGAPATAGRESVAMRSIVFNPDYQIVGSHGEQGTNAFEEQLQRVSDLLTGSSISSVGASSLIPGGAVPVSARGGRAALVQLDMDAAVHAADDVDQDAPATPQRSIVSRTQQYDAEPRVLSILAPPMELVESSSASRSAVLTRTASGAAAPLATVHSPATIQNDANGEVHSNGKERRSSSSSAQRQQLASPSLSDREAAARVKERLNALALMSPSYSAAPSSALSAASESASATSPSASAATSASAPDSVHGNFARGSSNSAGPALTQSESCSAESAHALSISSLDRSTTSSGDAAGAATDTERRAVEAIGHHLRSITSESGYTTPAQPSDSSSSSEILAGAEAATLSSASERHPASASAGGEASVSIARTSETASTTPAAAAVAASGPEASGVNAGTKSEAFAATGRSPSGLTNGSDGGLQNKRRPSARDNAKQLKLQRMESRLRRASVTGAAGAEAAQVIIGDALAADHDARSADNGSRSISPDLDARHSPALSDTSVPALPDDSDFKSIAHHTTNDAVQAALQRLSANLKGCDTETASAAVRAVSRKNSASSSVSSSVTASGPARAFGSDDNVNHQQHEKDGSLDSARARYASRVAGGQVFAGIGPVQQHENVEIEPNSSETEQQHQQQQPANLQHSGMLPLTPTSTQQQRLHGAGSSGGEVSLPNSPELVNTSTLVAVAAAPTPTAAAAAAPSLDAQPGGDHEAGEAVVEGRMTYHGHGKSVLTGVA